MGAVAASLPKAASPEARREGLRRIHPRVHKLKGDHERRAGCPGKVPILAVHDEIVVDCDEANAEKVKAWLEKAMVDGMDGVLNAPDAEGPRVPVEVEARSGRCWAG